MKWAFRIATGVRSGAGHVVRCEALAQNLDAQITVFADPDTSSFEWNANLCDALKTEARAESADELLLACREKHIDAVLVDSYSIPKDVVERLAQFAFTAAFRDSTYMGPENLSICIWPSAANSRAAIGGLRYAPLSARFAELRKRLHVAHSDPISNLRVLVSFGQQDSANRTATVIEALQNLDRPVHATIVMGARAVHLEKIRAITTELDSVEVIVSPKNIEDYYLSHNLAIGAPGVSQMERACCGLPTILIPQNKTQTILAVEWADSGLAFSVPPVAKEITAKIASLIACPTEIRRIRRNGMAAIDGQGAKRLADKLTGYAKGTLT